MDRILCLLIYIITAFSRCTKALARLGIGRYDEWKPGEKIKILLVGYNGARNTGSDVRVAAIARQVKELFGAENVQITVMTMDAETLKGYFDEDVTLLTFSSLFPGALYRACSTHHAAILCEGSSLKSTFANALTLFLCEAAGVMSRQGKPCIAYGSEVGEMEPFLARAASRLCRDIYFITRTEESLKALKALNLSGHAGTDAAWSYDGALDPQAAEELLRAQGWDGVRPLLGIAVINPFCWPVRASLSKWIRGLITRDMSGQYDKWYFFSDSPERRAAYKTYINEITKGVKAFMDKTECFPVLIGMERLDEKACRAVKAQLGTPAAMFLSGDNSADVMTGVLRRLSFLVTSRYHASVLSMEAAIPVVSVSMDERLDGIMTELGLADRYLMHVRDGKLGETVSEALFAAEAERGDISSRISRQLTVYKEVLAQMGGFMKEYISGRLHYSRGETD